MRLSATNPFIFSTVSYEKEKMNSRTRDRMSSFRVKIRNRGFHERGEVSVNCSEKPDSSVFFLSLSPILPLREIFIFFSSDVHIFLLFEHFPLKS